MNAAEGHFSACASFPVLPKVFPLYFLSNLDIMCLQNLFVRREAALIESEQRLNSLFRAAE